MIVKTNIRNAIQEKFSFEYRKADGSLWSRFESITEAASRGSDRQFHVVRSLFGRVLFCRVGGIILLPLLSTRRPPERKLIAFGDEDSEFFDPSVNAEHYTRLARTLAVSTEEEAVTYHQATQFDFAVVDKRSIPARIRGESDAQAHGFVLQPSERDFLRQPFSLWWQEWGGVLIKCRLAGNPTLVVSFEPIRYGAGKFKRLPASLVR